MRKGSHELARKDVLGRGDSEQTVSLGTQKPERQKSTRNQAWWHPPAKLSNSRVELGGSETGGQPGVCKETLSQMSTQVGTQVSHGECDVFVT